MYGLALRIARVKSGQTYLSYQDPCWRLSGVHYGTGRRQPAITEPNSTTMKGTKIHANSLKPPFPVFRVCLSQLLLLLLCFPLQVSCATSAWAFSRLFAFQVLLCFTVLPTRSESGCTRKRARGDHPAGEDFWPRAAACAGPSARQQRSRPGSCYFPMKLCLCKHLCSLVTYQALTLSRTEVIRLSFIFT